MKPPVPLFPLLMIVLTTAHFGMARHGQYDEEAREAERRERETRKELSSSSGLRNPIAGVASGVKQASYDSTAGLLSETAETTREEPLLLGTLEGARRGSEALVDNAVKGAFRVATLGYGSVDRIEKEEPESGKDEPTKFKIAIPGT